MKLQATILAGVFALSIAFPASADSTVYSQAPNQFDGYYSSNSSRYQVAESFTLASADSITSVSWYGFTLDDDATTSFAISFYSNDAGVPGTLLYTETVGGSGAATGNYPVGATEYVYNASISGLALSSGTEYWLGVVGASPDGDWLWETGDGVDNHHAGYDSDNDAWGGADNDLAFSLTGVSQVPEPSSLVLFSTSALSFAGLARKRLFNT